MKGWSQFRLDRIELVVNGEVMAAAKAGDNGQPAAVTEQTIRIDHSGWIAVRAIGPPNPDHPAPELYAHTGPVYVTVQDKPAASKADAQFFLAWIDRLAAALRERDRIPSLELKAHVESQIDAAPTIYRKIAEAQN